MNGEQLERLSGLVMEYNLATLAEDEVQLRKATARESILELFKEAKDRTATINGFHVQVSARQQERISLVKARYLLQPETLDNLLETSYSITLSVRRIKEG